jgi:hypothetical protein
MELPDGFYPKARTATEDIEDAEEALRDLADVIGVPWIQRPMHSLRLGA